MPKLPNVLKADFHLHTLDDPCDPQVYHTARELINKAAHLGFQILAITLHRKQFECEKTRRYARDRGILLIPGLEQEIEGKHVILLNFPAGVAEKIRDFASLRKHKTDQTFIIAPHPFHPGSISLHQKLLEHQDLFDAVEYAGAYLNFWNPNRKSVQVARRLGKPMVGNSDTHILPQLGTTWTEIHLRDSLPEKETLTATEIPVLFQAIRQGHCKVRTRALLWLEAASIFFGVILLGKVPGLDFAKLRRRSLNRKEGNSYSAQDHQANRNIREKKVTIERIQ